MNITVKANPIIDSLMPFLDDIQERYEHVPEGSYLCHVTPFNEIVNNAKVAERAFALASDILSIPESALYAAVLAARRWYYKTDWQKCLPEEDAQRLLACTIEKNSKRDYERESGNEYMLFMNKVISDWAKRSIEKQKTA